MLYFLYLQVSYRKSPFKAYKNLFFGSSLCGCVNSLCNAHNSVIRDLLIKEGLFPFFDKLGVIWAVPILDINHAGLKNCWPLPVAPECGPG